ncbi:beta-glucosidase [Sunxiuqinia indica]|uniref:beta-glucosidase n=1 Tax=Sunxiuqinia indica TaxID=2692584 RepID=UPI001F20385C|nr:glycoside hydrolase family 3 C-terminal domain-containing protein [Sunxiuqinia indica]
MTLEERFKLVRGNVFGTFPVERLGIPAVNFTDASSGIRITKNYSYDKTTSFPCLQLLAATWDTTMAYQYAKSIGEECRGSGIHFLLGPGMNIMRNSLCGRNFEYVGEDPFLAGEMVKSYVLGLQSTGTAATIKHFIGNEAEYNRKISNSVISKRALYEIYLPAFKKGIDAGAKSVMTSYNLLNGEWTAESKHLVTDILRHELNFKWLVMSDWGSVFNGQKCVQAGVDIEMGIGRAISRDSSKVYGTPEIDRMVENILKTCIYAGYYGDNYTDSTLLSNWGEREKIAYQTNLEGIVLLKNKGILPISPTDKKIKILVSGNNANRMELSAGGSSHVKGYNNRSYLMTLQETFGEENISYTEKPSERELKSATNILLFCGFPQRGKGCESEGVDRPFVLPDDDLIAKAVSLNKNTIICIQTGGAVKMDWQMQAAAIVQSFYGGQTGANALRDILIGKVNPSGKLPYTFEKRFEDSPAADYNAVTSNKLRRVPDDEVVDEKYANLFTNSKDTAKFYTYDVSYDEGIFVGYRWYDKKGIDVCFPFGHGLSYTTFTYDSLSVEKMDKEVIVAFNLANKGTIAGDEIAQLYVTDKECSVERPKKELKGFNRVSLLPGESKKVEIMLSPDAFKFWDEDTNTWKFEPGIFNIKVGASSHDIRLNADIVFD